MQLAVYFFLLPLTLLFAGWEKTNYSFSSEPIDVVIPCAEKDIEMLETCVERIRLHGKNIRRVIVVSKEPFTDSAEWFSESLYPFDKESIAMELFQQDREKATTFLHDPNNRLGWMLQQFLKLYAPLIIPGISSNVLVLDADVLFVNPVTFMTDQNRPLFAPASEYYLEYFLHAARLLPGFEKANDRSGIAHHMLFQRPVIEDLLRMIQEVHGVDAWKAICRTVNLNEIFLSPFSEYEIYFNFILRKTDQAIVRPLPFKDIQSVKGAKSFHDPKYAFVTSHAYNRKSDGE